MSRKLKLLLEFSHATSLHTIVFREFKFIFEIIFDRNDRKNIFRTCIFIKFQIIVFSEECERFVTRYKLYNTK